MKKFICPECNKISTDKDIDFRGMNRWTSSYTGISDTLIHQTMLKKDCGYTDFGYLPYICPKCSKDNPYEEWKEAMYTLPEELFTL